MADKNVPPPLLPAHIEATIHLIARIRSEHQQKASPLQRAIERMIVFVGRPRFVGLLAAFVASWIGLNLLASALGYRPIDPPPFSWLQFAASLASLFTVVLILADERREDQLAQLHEQLNLELAILSEQKTAKVIQLLEESRRDNPLIHNRVDQEAEAMARPADPKTVLEAIEETDAEVKEIRRGPGGS
jgi:uncharacterized membrane protein